MSLVQMSLTGGLFILFILIVRALAIHRLPKTTFLVLWGIAALRLLLPFSIPSPWSIYTYTGRLVNWAETGTGDMAFSLLAQPSWSPAAADIPSSSDITAVYTVIWLAGAGLMAICFVASYLKSVRKFRMSIPSDSIFAAKWLEAHPTIRPIEIRISDQIVSPITYGVFRPVILLPKRMDYEDHALLTSILTHEYVHIRRFDIVTKIILAVVLCIHWFNPLVWIMYILANRDIELSCDERVIQTLGEHQKAAYAFALIGMEEMKIGGSSLFSHFSKYAIEERTLAIMKYRKHSAVTVAFALVLIVGAAIFLATSPAVPAASPDFSDTETLSTGQIPDTETAGCYSLDGLDAWLSTLQTEADFFVAANQLTQQQAEEILLFYQAQIEDLNAAAAAESTVLVDKAGGVEQTSYRVEQLSFVPPAIDTVFEHYAAKGTLPGIAAILSTEETSLFYIEKF